MPHNETAGRVSEAYRAQLLRDVTSTATAVAASLGGVDLDGSRRAVAGDLAAWEDTATRITEAGQSQAANLAHRYIGGYLEANAADPTAGLDQVDLRAHVGQLEAHGIDGGKLLTVEALFASASYGLLWSLGRGRGREASVAYGKHLASRTAVTGVTYTAGATLTDLMVASPDVTGWRRLCSSKTCQRCAERATQTHPAAAKMWRHPGDRCQQEPVVRGHSPLVRASPTVVRP